MAKDIVNLISLYGGGKADTKGKVFLFKETVIQYLRKWKSDIFRNI